MLNKRYSDYIEISPTFESVVDIDAMTIRDEMFADASMHNKDGAYQAIFGVNTLLAMIWTK